MTARDLILVARMRAGGIRMPIRTLQEARREGLPLALACAMLEQETGGGRNIFGHDRDVYGNVIFTGSSLDVRVTRRRYRRYKAFRIRTGQMQGVGPCQLTWYSFQDAADAAGGCWKPRYNMRIGFRHLARLVRMYGHHGGVRRYNGEGDAAERYADQVLERYRAWHARLRGKS